MVTATNHFIRLLVSGKSVKKADRTKGGKYLDKKEQIWRQRREREEEREIDSGSVTLYAKAKQMIDLNIYTESKPHTSATESLGIFILITNSLTN